MSSPPSSALLRRQAAKCMRLAHEVRDALTQSRLEELAADYVAQADIVDRQLQIEKSLTSPDG